jgi:twitching motility protein PilT
MEIPRMEQIGLPLACRWLIQKPRGLFLVAGPAGSGRSTSVASMLDFLNETFEHRIVTIEDRIKFDHPNKKSTVSQWKIGSDVLNFAEALRRALQENPDVIMVGELRDLATIEAAITAAERGSIVIGTLHATDAQRTVNRIIDAFPSDQQDQIRTRLSNSLIAVLSQTLVPKIGGGRIAAYELLVCTLAIGNLIRENKTFRITSAIQTGAKLGMMLLDDSLLSLWKEKKCAKADAIAASSSPDELTARVAAAENFGHNTSD